MDSHTIFSQLISRFQYILLYGLFVFTLPAFAQEQLSDDPDVFVPEFVQMLDNIKTEKARAAAGRFESLYEEGSLTPEMVAGFAESINVMKSRRMGPAAYMVTMAASLNGIAGYGHPDARYAEWLDIVNRLLATTRSPNNVNLKKWLIFSDKFFNNWQLYSSRSRIWEVEAEDYRFKMEGKKPEVFFPLLELVGITTGDTVRIMRARGSYWPVEERWQGTQGRIDWARAGFDPSNVYTDFRTHRISFKEAGFAIDSAVLTYKPVLEQKLMGRFLDKLVQNNNPDKTSYPRFRSYDDSTSNIELYPNVKYIGQFALEGYQFRGFGAKGNRAILEFYNENGELAVRARTNDSFVDDRDRIHSGGAEVVIYFKGDSIYHPNIQLRFDQQYSELSLEREDRGATSAPFFSSYHGLEFNPIQLLWNIDDTTVYMKPEERVGRKTAEFLSVNLFDEPLYHQVQGPVSYHPLVVMKRYADQVGRTTFGTLEIAQAFNRSLSIDGVQAILYELMTLGFIFYDKANEQVRMLDKTNNYVLAKAERIDYDVIKMISTPGNEQPNAVLSFASGEMKVNGVFEVNLSDSQFVRFFPEGRTLDVRHNRDMEFGGTLFGGSSDFYGGDFFFSYDSFQVKMNYIDSMVLFTTTDKLDDKGQPLIEPLKTTISGLSGTLFIDRPDNKSSRLNFPEYPIFISSSPAFAHYDKPGIHRNAYDQERFYFEVDNFSVDSLANIDSSKLGFSGTLKSGGIFPDIKNQLTIMEDRSLGFETETDPGGMSLYEGDALFYDKIALSNDGLTGAGRIEYLTAELEGNRIYFFPDSAQGRIQKLTVAKQLGSIQFPDVKNNDVDLDWKPNGDSMTLHQGTTPFSFFEGQTELEGSITITPEELSANGIMDWDEARAKSEQFRFGANSMLADTSFFVIKSPVEGQFALKLNNASANIDFATRKGYFKSNDRDEPTELPFNRYQTNINEFDWDMDAKRIAFKTEGREYSSFLSLAKRQEGLRFKAKSGVYNMEDHQLQLEGVPYIAVGDAHVYPAEGKVIIEEDAIMQTLEGARIEFDSLAAFHEIVNAEIRVQGKNKMRGEGDYVYRNRLGVEQNIRFEEIGVRTITSEFGDTIFETFARGAIPDSQLFYLDPRVLYKGPVSVSSTKEEVQFDGYAKMNITDTSFATGWFRISDDIQSDNFQIDIDTAIGENRDTAYVGIYKLFGGTELYPLVIRPTRRAKDKPVLLIKGIVQFQEDRDEFVFGDPDRADGFSNRGSLFRLHDKTGRIIADGPLDLMVDFGNCRHRAAGKTVYNPGDSAWKFNTTIALKLLLTDDLLTKFSRDFFEMNLDAPYLDYFEGSNLVANLPQIMDPKQEKLTLQDVEMVGEFSRPKGWDYDISLSDLELVWNEGSESWRTTTFTAGVLHIGDLSINQQATVIAEFAPRGAGDYFNLYLESDLEEWFFFTYRKGVLKVVSSLAEYNQLVRELDPKKSTFKDDDGLGFSVLTHASVTEKNRFLSKMGYFDDEEEEDDDVDDGF